MFLHPLHTKRSQGDISSPFPHPFETKRGKKPRVQPRPTSGDIIVESLDTRHRYRYLGKSSPLGYTP